MRRAALGSLAAGLAATIGLGLLPTSVAAETRPTAYLSVIPMTEKDCVEPWRTYWTVLGGACTPGALTIGIGKEALEFSRFTELYQVSRERNSPKFCKGLKGKKAKKCLAGSHFTRTLIPTNAVCDYVTVVDGAGNRSPQCAVKRHLPVTGVLAPGNYIFHLSETRPGRWECSVYYEEVCRWDKGYTVYEEILFTWTGTEIQSERVSGGVFI
jgi:hypothetical protein